MKHLQLRNAFSLLEILVSIAIIALLVSLALPAIQKVRSSAQQSACTNHLRQLALSLHSYHDAYGQLPTGNRGPRSATRLYAGWQLEILPYIEQSSLHQRALNDYRLSAIPFIPAHQGLSTTVRIYVCPSDPRIQSSIYLEQFNLNVGFTSYLGICGISCFEPDGCLYQDSTIRFAQVTDGLTNTLLIGERPPSNDFIRGWWYAGVGQRGIGSTDMILGVNEPNREGMKQSCASESTPYQPSSFHEPCGVYHFWSPHLSGANFALADGSVRKLPYTIAPQSLFASATRQGAEIITD